MNERPISWVENEAVAERRHGESRDTSLFVLKPENEERWAGPEGRRELGVACWESGWDAAVIYMRNWFAHPARKERARDRVRELMQRGGVQFTKQEGYMCYGDFSRDVLHAADWEGGEP